MNPVAPSPQGLTGIALGALVVNVICAVLLMQLRDEGSSLATGAWLAARNDALANVLIIAVGLLRSCGRPPGLTSSSARSSR